MHSIVPKKSARPPAKTTHRISHISPERHSSVGPVPSMKGVGLVPSMATIKGMKAIGIGNMPERAKRR